MNATCAHCGSATQPDDGLCPSCGWRLDSDQSADTRSGAAINRAPAPRREARRKIGLLSAAVRVVLLIVSVLGWVAPARTSLTHEPGAHGASLLVANHLSADPGGRAVASIRNACHLLSVEELSKGLDSSYTGATPSANGEDEISCEYAPGAGNTYPATLTVTLKYGKTTMAGLQGAGNELVAGTKVQNDLGDASFYMPMDIGIYALKGDLLVALQFGLGKGTREQKQALVKKVLGRL